MHVIANRWYALLTSAELQSSRPLGARRLGQDLVFWRNTAGSVRVAMDACPHRGAKVSAGRMVNGCLECPFHGFQFADDGACTFIPPHPDRTISPAMRLDTLPSREEHGFIWVWTGPEAATDAPIPFFDFGDLSCAGSADAIPVRTHYTRAIENQLDYSHLPFVHRRTIGRFVTDVAREQFVETDGDVIRFGPSKDADALIEFIGPNIWRLRTGRAWQFLAFVPVDDDNMLYYTRSYQGVVGVPGLSWLVGRMGRFFNRFIFAEDTAVVESQPAVETRLRMGEMLVPSDGPIIAYRRWREANRTPFPPEKKGRTPTRTQEDVVDKRTS